MRQTEGIISNLLDSEVKKVEIKKVEGNQFEVTADEEYIGKFTHYSPKVESYSKYKDYRRFPVILSNQSIIVIHHFKDDGGLEQTFEHVDMIEENQAAMERSYTEWDEAAKQFFDQLEGHYSDAFLQSLILEATKKLQRSDKRRKKMADKKEDMTGVSDGCFENRAQAVLTKAQEILNTPAEN